MTKKNILLIISDQQRIDTVGCLGRSPCRTPHIDSLIERGVIFEKTVTPSPVCTPARAALFTGLYPHQARGTLDIERKSPLSDDQMTADATDMLLCDYSCREDPILTDKLKSAGYYCCYAGKWHIGNDILDNWFEHHHGEDDQQYVKWAEQQGYPDAWPLNDNSVRSHRDPPMSIPRAKENIIPPEKTNDAWITDITIRSIEQRPKDKPFMAVCSMNGPHPPFKIPEPYFSMYDNEEVPEPPNFHLSEGKPKGKEQSFYHTLWKDHGLDWSAWKKTVTTYWGFVTHIDDQVGRLIQCLENEGVFEDTLIIFCSDHGEMLGQQGLWHKMQAYEESLRVPMVFSAPWIKCEKRSTTLSSLIDIAPTILSVSGCSIPGIYEGENLTSILYGECDCTARSVLLSEHKPDGDYHRETDWRMVTDNKFKYIWNHGECEELYDLESDPWEKVNLANSDRGKERLTFYQSLLGEWMEKTKDPLYEEF